MTAGAATVRPAAGNGPPPRPRLLPQHERLIADSAITPEVAAARGYFSAENEAELERLGFGRAQCLVPGLVTPIRDARGEIVTHQLRPDVPRRNKLGKPVKYETPVRSRMAVDIPAGARGHLGDPRRPLFITEGARKADAAVSRGLCCVALLGVWNWRGKSDQGGTLALADWEDVALNDRSIYIAFDSDVMEKPGVRDALSRLKPYLEHRGRGASVRLIYLPAGPGGTKVGLDDFFHAGGTVEQLLALATDELRELPSAASAGTGGGRGPTQATQLLALADDAGIELFHTPEGEAWARVPINGHRETWRLSNGGFKRYLRQLAYTRDRAGVSKQTLEEAIGTLDSRAHFDGPERRVFTRVGEHDGALFLDLADEQWRAIEVHPEIEPHGWRVVSDPAIYFRRSAGQLALPEPTPGGSLDELRPLVNVADDDGWVRLVGWLLGAINPRGPYPILCLHGEQASAKSTTGKLLRALIDPRQPELRAAPQNPRDLAIAAQANWCLALDNLSEITPWLSDALCRLADGAGYATRKNYSDDEEALFEACRPILLTSIEELTTRSDLLSRTLLLGLPPIRRFRGKRELEVAFTQARPRLLGALLAAAACALARRDDVVLARRPRMADFAEWVTAAEPALGWADGRFMAADSVNQHAANAIAIEASPIGPAMLELAASGFEGTFSELGERLSAIAGEHATQQRGWPSKPHVLSNQVRRLAPNLRDSGCEIEIANRGRDRDKRATITLQLPNRTSGPSGPSGPDNAQPVQQSQIAGVATAPSETFAGSTGPLATATSHPVGPLGAAPGPLERDAEIPANTGMGPLGAAGAAPLLQTEKELASPATAAEELRAARLLAEYGNDSNLAR